MRPHNTSQARSQGGGGVGGVVRPSDPPPPLTAEGYIYKRNEPIFGVELTVKLLEIKNISRERFKSLVYGGVYRFCRAWSIFFSNVRL